MQKPFLLKDFFAQYRAQKGPKTWMGPFDSRAFFGSQLLERLELWPKPGGFQLLVGQPDAMAEVDAEPFAFVEERIQHFQRPALGFLSYEAAQIFESLSMPSTSSPLFRFDIYENFKECRLPTAWDDHAQGTTSDCQALQAAWEAGRYESKVQAIRELILAGDVYQVNLVQAFLAALGADRSAELFSALRAADTSLEGYRVLHENIYASAESSKGAEAILSDSPELFLKRQGGRLQTCPIKGTRAFASKSSRLEASQALLNSSKDRAELAMIVDLMRNDLSRVCQVGTVRVKDFPEILSLPHLVHTQARIQGELRKGVSFRDCLAATFPSGSITGCPRIRAMQRIAELEGRGRGAAFGSMGILEVNGDFTLNVAIRTATLTEKSLELLAGGGITVDSVPAEEAQESRLKVKAFQAAIAKDSRQN
jgi:anthranilate/para-aminobenzoate synthase component I